MQHKTMIKVLVDIIMTALFLVLTAYHMTGSKVHEWLGALLFILFILHHILNWNWYKSLFKGKYTTVRILHMAVNMLLMTAMLGMMISGIMISREVFDFLNINAARLGRRLHMASTSWGFLLMSVHLGFHWDMVIGVAKKMTKKSERTFVFISWWAAAILSAYGIYAFISRQIWHHLFLVVEYAFFDYEEPLIFFFADYITIMGLFACAAYYTVKLIRKME